jgi:1,2-diacylglycerol 3-alpha-glucosyltransferase
MVHTYHTIYEDYTHYVTHNKTLDRRAKAFARVFTRLCCNHVEQVIVPTSKVKELLLRYNVNRDITVVPTGVNLKKFDPSLCSNEDVKRIKDEIGIAPKDKVVIYIGRISKEKNIGEIIDAMPEYMKLRENAKFVIIGGGPDMDNLVKKVKNFNLEERIIFTGPKPWDDIGLYYRIGDVFVSGSTSETQGLTYIEAMAAGLPVVARDDKCLDEILDIGKNGYKFTKKDELIHGLDAILYESLEIPYGENARIKMRKYSTEEFAKNILSVYEEVMNRELVYTRQNEIESKKINQFFPKY